MVQVSTGLTFGAGGVDWQDRINVDRLRTGRAARMKEVMRRHGIPSLLVTGASHCRYLVGLKGPEYTPQLWYVLFFVEHEPVVFMHAGFITQLAQEAPWIQEVRLARCSLAGICGPEAVAEEVAKFAVGIDTELQARGLKHEPLAVIGFDEPSQSALRGRDLKLINGWPLMFEAETRKTPEEIQCFKLATAMAEAAWTKVIEALRPGVTEDELVRRGWCGAHAAGAEEVKIGFRSGPLTFERGMNMTSRVIQAGDLIYGNLCSTQYMGYRTCLYRTFYVGAEVPPKAADWYRRLLDRVNGVIQAIRPGATTADAARNFAPASTWGYEDEAWVLASEIGHGLGLRQYERPVINRQWSLEHPQTFEPGMVIAVESREGAHGEGGVRLEDMVLVTDHGCEILDHFPRDEVLAIPFV